MAHPPTGCTLTAHELTYGATELLSGLAESVRPTPEGVR